MDDVARAELIATADDPMPAPRLYVFDRVVAAGLTRHRAGVAVTIFSLELFDDGFRIRAQVDLARDHPDYRSPLEPETWDDPPGRTRHFRSGFPETGMRLTDDRGGSYLFMESRADSDGARIVLDFACGPRLDPSCRALNVSVPQLLWQDPIDPMAGFLLDPGPWDFTIPLG
ncbi:hypothetical protein AB0B25_11480 [Nocardia sp. NPDC049190]|uniref:hypothetical protein n=1 Tax=Nocardia sp. NPDC049190 TaxID=3155650 RepID=UPI0033D71314